MPKKALSADDENLITTIARGVGSAVGKIANTAHRLTANSAEAIQSVRIPGKTKKTAKKSGAPKKKVAGTKKKVTQKPARKPKTRTKA